jgi:hypothetical protein
MSDFAFVSRIQKRFFDAGWLWQEQIFDNGDVVIRFTLNKWCHAMDSHSNPNYFEDCRYGWGRFQRWYAWVRAERFLLDHIGEKPDIERLIEYEAKYKE